MEHELISVIMPVYNAEKYVAEAVDSILGQSYPYFELIIVDDCGSDRSMDIISGFADQRIRILRNDRNRGIGYSRNRAIKESRGSYIAIMDDDDRSFPWRFEKQITYLREHTEIDILGGAVEAINAQGEVIRKALEPLYNPFYIKVNFLFHCIFHNSEVMLRKSLLKKQPVWYSENCYGMEDFRFWIECSKIGYMTNIPDIILQHRYHEETETARVKRYEYEDRKRYYGELQKLSFELSGFILSDRDYQILTESFPEGTVAEMPLEKISKLMEVMGRIILQASENKMDFQKELKIYLRKQIYEAVRKCKELQDSF